MRRTGSAVGCCSSVAMDHLNSLCCIHVGWEQCRVQVPSDRVGRKPRAADVVSDVTSEELNNLRGKKNNSPAKTPDKFKM